jgi:HAMP domain-containing protein
MINTCPNPMCKYGPDNTCANPLHVIEQLEYEVRRLREELRGKLSTWRNDYEMLEAEVQRLRIQIKKALFAHNDDCVFCGIKDRLLNETLEGK